MKALKAQRSMKIKIEMLKAGRVNQNLYQAREG